MKKPNFLAGSVLFHLAAAFILLVLPPPYPRLHQDDTGDYIPVVLTKATSRDVPDFDDREPMFPGDGPVIFSGKAMMAKSDVPFPEQGAPRPNTPAGRRAGPASEDSHPPGSEEAPSRGRDAGASTPAGRPGPQPARQGAPPPQAPDEVSLVSAEGVSTDRAQVEFKYQRGWPVPGMVRVGLGGGVKGRWRASGDRDWIIVSPSSGDGPGGFRVGVDTSRLQLGFYEGRVKVTQDGPAARQAEIPVTLMVLPKDEARPELPHTSWDRYMSGDCKVCHLPEELLPSADFMTRPEFCGLCHNAAGMASARLVDGTGHPMLIEAGSGGTKRPTYGTVPTGPGSDSMASHLNGGKLVVCVTCHNVMEKPGDYGRAWEMTTTNDRKTYRLHMGGWAGMGHIEPRVYVTDGLMARPKLWKSARAYLARPSSYTYDEAEGAVAFRTSRKPGENVYVSLDTPYLRVTTESNRLCFDCHFENTHRGLNCLDCHRVHGTDNIMAVRQGVRGPDGVSRKVVFTGRKGKNSLADGDGAYDGICEVCHTRTKCHRRGGGPALHADGKDYSGTDCTRCHSHADGFGI